jgi:predicted dehydrogenase
LAIQACKSGKDVYVEKPLAHNIREGRLMVEAARQNKRVVQVGTQQRSGSHYRAVVESIQAGKIGKISRVAAWNLENQSPHGIGVYADCPNPPDLDYDLWLGPAPKRAFNPNRFIYNFRFFWDYAGGHATDWGVHHVDIVQWAMNERAPKRVSAFGGKYVLNDNRETPDTLDVIFEFSNFTYSYSNRLVNANPLYSRSFGIAFYGAEGTLVVDRAGYEVLPENRGVFEQPVPAYTRELESASATGSAPRWSQERNVRKGRTESLLADGSEQHLAHVKNFLECVRSRKAPASDVEVTHHSTTTVHLANISLRTGRTIVWDSENEQVRGDSEATQYLSRSYREPWIVS